MDPPSNPAVFLWNEQFSMVTEACAGTGLYELSEGCASKAAPPESVTLFPEKSVFLIYSSDEVAGMNIKCSDDPVLSKLLRKKHCSMIVFETSVIEKHPKSTSSEFTYELNEKVERFTDKKVALNTLTAVALMMLSITCSPSIVTECTLEHSNAPQLLLLRKTEPVRFTLFTKAI
jgi:hypothetical protein